MIKIQVYVLLRWELYARYALAINELTNEVVHEVQTPVHSQRETKQELRDATAARLNCPVGRNLGGGRICFDLMKIWAILSVHPYKLMHSERIAVWVACLIISPSLMGRGNPAVHPCCLQDEKERAERPPPKSHYCNPMTPIYDWHVQ